jgi:hypothetical protein
MPPRARALGALLVLVVLALCLLPMPARAQTSSDAAPVLVLAAQDSWTKPGGVFTMHLRAEPKSSSATDATTAVTTGLNLVLILHDRVTTRTAFDASIAEPTPSQPDPALPTQLGPRISAPYDSLALDASGNRVFSVPLQGPNDAETPDHLSARRPGGGVYPLEVQLRDANDQRVSGFVTDVVVTDVVAGTGDGTTAPVWADGRALDLAWVWPLVTTPAYLPDGTPDPAVVEEMAPAGRLGHQAAAIDSLADVPLTLVPAPETVDAWQAIARQRVDVGAGIAAIQRAVAHDEVLAGPFVPLDLPAMTTAGLEGALDTQLTRGSATLDRVLGQRLDPRTAVPGPLDQHSLQLLRQRGVDRLVLSDPSALSPANEQFTPAHPIEVLATPGDDTSAMTAVAGDAGLERLLTGAQPPALRAARLLAGLAVVAREQPNVSRGITLVNPSDWDPDDGFVAAVAAGLRQNPMLRPVTVSGLLQDVPVPDEPARTVVSRPVSTGFPITSKQFYKAFTNLLSIDALLTVDNPIAARGDRAINAAMSSTWENPRGREAASALLASVGASMQGFLSGIRIPAGTTVTVTSSSAEIPLTFQNDTGQPVRIHVQFESDKLLFPNGNGFDVDLPTKNTTIRFAVETRTSGTFPVAVTLTTADAAHLPIQSTQLRVRSTFVSGVGVFLTVAAGLFLALWWGWDIRKRRRAKRGEGPRPTVLPASA